MVLEASPDIKFEILEQERVLIRKELKQEMKRDISNLKANILAYQDLLVIKEAEIRAIQGSLSEYGNEGDNNFDDKLRIELENIRESYREKIETIAKLEQALK